MDDGQQSAVPPVVGVPPVNGPTMPEPGPVVPGQGGEQTPPVNPGGAVGGEPILPSQGEQPQQ